MREGRRERVVMRKRVVNVVNIVVVVVVVVGEEEEEEVRKGKEDGGCLECVVEDNMMGLCVCV